MEKRTKMKKKWEKPKLDVLSVKGLTLHGYSYATNESIGSYEYSPSNKYRPNQYS